MTLFSHNPLFWSSFAAPAGWVGVPFMLAFAIAEWGVYLAPTSLLALWISGNKATRVMSLRALLTAAGAVLASKMIALLWSACSPAAGNDGFLSPIQSGHDLTPSVTIALILTTGLTLWTARAIKIRWIGVLLVGLSLVVSWAKIFLGMHYPLDIFGAGLVSLAMMLAMNSKYGIDATHRLIRFIRQNLNTPTLLSEISHLLYLPSPRIGHGNNGARITLHTCLAHSRPGLSYVAKQFKLSLRTLVHYHQTQRWLAYWNATPMHAMLAQATPRRLQKIYRPYQSLRLRSQDRMNMLVSHYDFIFRQGLGPLVLRASREALLLGSFSGKSGAIYEIRLSAIATLDREGELALDLCCDQRRLFSVAFTFYGDELVPCVGIGCLQGPRGNDSQERVRSATRDMFGLRPKSLMVRLVREIGRAYGYKKLILVGNENRVLFHQIRIGQVHADYNDFWQEIGATRRSDGEYELSCDAIPVVDLQQIPSHKRSEARKRMELTERAVQAALGGFAAKFDATATLP